MSFTGKATYSAGSALPELAEDVSDLVSINSPHDTPLLDAVGDPLRPARSTLHEWLEDELLANTDTVGSATISNPAADGSINVVHINRFQVGDQVSLAGGEVVLVTGISTGDSRLTVVRQYGSTNSTPLSVGMALRILGNAALEGDDAPAARFTTRSRRTNHTQIFSATVEVSGSELAATQIGVADELDYQKLQRTRELMRDLENSVINGRAPAANPEGSSSVRRSMNGLLAMISSHVFTPVSAGYPEGESFGEQHLNWVLRQIWESSASQVDLIVVNGSVKSAISQFMAASRRYTPEGESYKNVVSTYESDFGICRVVLSRWVPADTVLFLDSTRIAVMPLAGRSFYYKPLASRGDREGGQIIGEYTLEVRNENAHGVLKGLAV